MEARAALVLTAGVLAVVAVGAPASAQTGCAADGEAWFVGAVYDDAQRADFRQDVRNYERFDDALQEAYCYDESRSTVLAFEDDYTDDELGTTYEAATEANLKAELAEVRQATQGAEDPVVFVFLSSHGIVHTGALSDDCPATRPVHSYAFLAGGDGEDGFLDDCELGDALDAFDPGVRMAVFVDCSLCGGFSDSLTPVSGTVPDGGTPSSSNVPGENRIVVTGCAVTTECFGHTGDGAILYRHMLKALQRGDCDGFTAPGFPTVQGVNAPVRDPLFHERDGTCSVSELVFGAVDSAYDRPDVAGIQQQFRMKYGFDTLEADLPFAPAGRGIAGSAGG